MKIILWGTGKIANKAFNYLNCNSEIVGLVDSDEKKWGTVWNSLIIRNPDEMLNQLIYFDKIIIAISNWGDMKEYIIKKYGISKDKIDNIFFLKRIEFIDNYLLLENVSKEQRVCIEYVQNYGLDVFNYGFAKKYDQINVDVHYDENKDLYYTYYNNYRMYFNRDYRKKTHIINYMRGILREQDEESPHYYNIDHLDFNEDTVVLDAGVAEGNFALDVINKVKKIYLVEADSNWCEALKYTFEPFGDKVTIINGFLGNGEEGSITIDNIINGQKLDILKMDIEGAEYEALQGAVTTIRNNQLQLRVCSYHNLNDYDRINAMLRKEGYDSISSDGYMVFVTTDRLELDEIPQLVHGLIYAEKRGLA